ncbi:MAG: alpha/beta hydrolase-fold protein, partial [Longimicrobiales bacterium]
MVVFPTSMGSFFEWEDQKMPEALSEHLERGWLQLYCVDSVDKESWYAKKKPMGDRAWRQELYNQYIRNEVIPFSEHRNPTPYLIMAGASFGAYHALNFALRYPDLVNRVIGMSGMYNIKELTRGYSDDNVYSNDPSHYALNFNDHVHLEALRRMDIILAIGRDDPHYQDNIHISNALWQKNVWHAFRVWDGWSHDWPWWREMIKLYAGGAD